jgi:hypothetical protein
MLCGLAVDPSDPNVTFIIGYDPGTASDVDVVLYFYHVACWKQISFAIAAEEA